VNAGPTPYEDQPVPSSKIGLDDYAYLKGPEAAIRLIERAVDSEAFERKSRGAVHHPYLARDGAIWKSMVNKDGVPMDTRLTTFIARIVGEVIEDNGLEQVRHYEIEGIVAGETSTFTIPAQEFRSLGWVAIHLGKAAIILPPTEDREVAAAIQLISPEDAPARARYTHTGWIRHEGLDCFLDAQGAIGADGRIEGVDVALPPQFANYYVIEDPGGPEAQVEAIRASFAIAKVVEFEHGVVLLAAAYQAPVEQPPDSTFLEGLSGSFKSSKTALSLQHFGRKMDHLHLTESFASTLNSLREVAFQGKDVLVAVDDYSRPPDHYKAAELDAKAEGLFRGIGNRAARSRAARDGSLRAAHPPRCAMISNGTQVPPADDVQARLTILHVRKDSLDRQAFKRSQQDGARGLFAQSMFGFIKWLARDRQARLDYYHRRRLELRERFQVEDAHPRTSDAMAAKMACLELVVEYACDAGALNDGLAEELLATFEQALIKVAHTQIPDNSVVDPAERFVHLLRDALAAGRCHITDVGGVIPPSDIASACGWKPAKTGGDLMSAGLPIGWLDGLDSEDLFLNPSESMAVVQRLSQDMKQPLVIGERDLRRRLLEAGYLIFDRKAKREKGNRGTLTVRKTHQGRRLPVLHLDAKKVLGLDTDECDTKTSTA
jgi:hypothetical protein